MARNRKPNSGRRRLVLVGVAIGTGLLMAAVWALPEMML